MNLATVYKDIDGIHGVDYFLKKEYGKNAVKFLKVSCKLAGVVPLEKVYHNKGGDAIWGEIICKVKHPDPAKDRVLEIWLAESGAFYRTNGKGGFGPNVWIAHFYNTMDVHRFLLKHYKEADLSLAIKDFLENTDPRLF
jgi:hypothetical protein